MARRSSIATLAVLALCAPLAADYIEDLYPVFTASIRDQPIDGSGDVVTLTAPHSISITASAEDRAVQEFDVTNVDTFDISMVLLEGKVLASDTTALGLRTFDFLLYDANGVAENGDFEAPAVVVGSGQYEPPTDAFLAYSLEVTDAALALLESGVTHIGLRVQSTSSPNVGNDLVASESVLYVEHCDIGTGWGYCAGGAHCPCGNAGVGVDGCDNSNPGIGGAFLSGAGGAFIGSDTFYLKVSGLPPNKAGLCIKGSDKVGVPFGIAIGDGLLCLSPELRSQVIYSDAAGDVVMDNWRGQPFSNYPGAANPNQSWTYYQWWYRDTANTCSGWGFNFSNGLQVAWF